MLAERLAHFFARQFDQPQRGDSYQVRARAILAQTFAQHVQERFALLAPIHVDKVDDDDAAHIAQAQLPGDLARGFAVEGENRFRERALADELAGVDVHHGERLGVIKNQIAAALQPHKAAKGTLGLFPDAKAVEQRRLGAVEDDARGKGRRQRPRRLPQGVKQGVIIRAHAFDILAEHVAHGAVDEAAVAVQQRRRGDVFAALLDGRPKPAEGLEVGAQRLRARALGGGANNDAVAKRSRQ